MYFVPVKLQTQFTVVGRREMDTTTMNLTDLSLGVSDFEALSLCQFASKHATLQGNAIYLYQLNRQMTKLHMFI